MMGLIAECGGNVSSEHGVGSRKRAYLGMSRQANDVACADSRPIPARTAAISTLVVARNGR